MQHEDRDREQEMATGVRVAHERLLTAYQDTPKGAVEDEVRLILGMDEDNESRLLTDNQRREMKDALAAYVVAVNALWLYAEEAGITRSLVSNWTRRNRKNLAEIDRTEYDVEGTFAMRSAVCGYRAGQAALRTFAQKFVDAHLNAYRGQKLSAVELPVREAKMQRESNRVEGAFEDLDSDE